MKSAANRSKALQAGGLLGLLLAAAPLSAQSKAAPAFHPHRMPPMQQAAPPSQMAGQAPIERRAPGGAGLPQASAAPQGAFRGRGEHLTEWMGTHGNMSPQQQQEALRNEPGFHELPQQTQQRYLDRLNQLNAMAPEKRQRMLQQTERMEQLSPEQRTAVRSATMQWGALPPDDKRVVGKAFRELRGMPPDQRLSVLNNRYRNLSPQGRQALTQLMQVEPFMPPDHF